MHLAPIDWTIIGVYLIGCMAAGIYMRRFVHGVEDFAVAGRAMDLNLGIASLAATELGLVTVMYTAQLGFTNGFAGATIGLLMAAAMYLVGCTGFVIGPLRRAGVMTIPELFQTRFGTRVRWLAGFIYRPRRRAEHGNLFEAWRRIPGRRHGDEPPLARMGYDHPSQHDSALHCVGWDALGPR